jgi:TPR repeat protein
MTGNMEQAEHYFKLAAENGDAEAGRNLQQMQAIRKAQEHNSKINNSVAR